MIILKVNGMNLSIKNTGWGNVLINNNSNKKDSTICCPQKTCFRSKDTHTLKVKGQKRYPMQIITKRLQGAYDNIRQLKFEPKTIARDKERYYVMKKLKVKVLNRLFFQRRYTNRP